MTIIRGQEYHERARLPTDTKIRACCIINAPAINPDGCIYIIIAESMNPSAKRKKKTKLSKRAGERRLMGKKI